MAANTEKAAPRKFTLRDVRRTAGALPVQTGLKSGKATDKMEEATQ